MFEKVDYKIKTLFKSEIRGKVSIIDVSIISLLFDSDDNDNLNTHN